MTLKMLLSQEEFQHKETKNRNRRRLRINIQYKTTRKITLSGVDSSKYKVYYSENANATKDLNDKSNNWTETLTNKVQSYMIVLNEI